MQGPEGYFKNVVWYSYYLPVMECIRSCNLYVMYVM